MRSCGLEAAPCRRGSRAGREFSNRSEQDSIERVVPVKRGVLDGYEVVAARRSACDATQVGRAPETRGFLQSFGIAPGYSFGQPVTDSPSSGSAHHLKEAGRS